MAARVTLKAGRRELASLVLPTDGSDPVDCLRRLWLEIAERGDIVTTLEISEQETEDNGNS